MITIKLEQNFNLSILITRLLQMKAYVFIIIVDTKLSTFFYVA